MELFRNKRSYLVDQILEILPEYESDYLWPLTQNLTEEKYKFLLFLKSSQKLTELRDEIKTLHEVKMS